MATTTTLNLCPLDLDVCVTRGDTVAWTFTVQNSAGVATDITGATFLLTVDPDPAPTTSAANLFQLTGTVTDAPNGVVEFAMSPTQADQVPSVYFFDLQMTDVTGAIRTLAKGKFEFRQDITK